MKEETSRVCILGPGWDGKDFQFQWASSIIHSSRHDFLLPEKNLVWVPCIEATSATLLLALLSFLLHTTFDYNQVTIEEIISLLGTSTQPRLIVLDNFETPYYSALDGSQKQVEVYPSSVSYVEPCRDSRHYTGRRPSMRMAVEGYPAYR